MSNKEAQRQWRERNKEKIKEYSLKYRAENKEKIALVKKKYDKEYNVANREKKRVYIAGWQRENPEKYLLCLAKTRAKKENLDFNLEVNDIVIPTHCPLLNIPIECNRGLNRRKNSLSIDRIDNSIGYIKGNVWVISWQANVMKHTASKEDLIVFSKNILEKFNAM